MLFQPVDENSLRHLFSSGYAEHCLGLSYVGPVLNSAGKIEPSPDCVVWDKRESPFKPLRCEFKFIPSSKEEFAKNGEFTLAVIWSLPPGLAKNKLLKDLREQNGCEELIVLTEFRQFRELPVYDNKYQQYLKGVDALRKLVLHRDRTYPAVFALCVAVAIYPDKFEMNRMVALLDRRFPEVKRMPSRGKANVVTAFAQSKPPLIEHKHGHWYCWKGDIDSKVALTELSQIISERFNEIPPTADDINLVRH